MDERVQVHYRPVRPTAFASRVAPCLLAEDAVDLIRAGRIVVMVAFRTPSRRPRISITGVMQLVVQLAHEMMLARRRG